MLYMVETNLQDKSLIQEWDEWYEEHIRVLLSIPGILSAQRFQATATTASPFLAIYTLAHGEVLSSPAYRAKAGPDSTGVWKNRMTNWHRNVLNGMSSAPEVRPGEWLAVMDRRMQAAPPIPAGYASLVPIGLDRTHIQRGIMVGRAEAAPPISEEHGNWNIRVFEPLGVRHIPPYTKLG